MVVNCPKCLGEFATQRDLDRHLQRKTPCDSGNVKCNSCATFFTSERGLKDHIKNGRCKGKSLALVNSELAEQVEQLKTHAQQHEQSLQMTTPIATDENNDHTASSSCNEPSQTTIDQPPTIIDWPYFFEFGDYKIRKTGETPQRVSVHDFIAAITDQSASSARKNFSRLKLTYSEVVARCRDYKFSGSGQKDTPVTDARGAVIIMNLLPGHKAADFRVACADIIVRYLGGDETLIGEIQRNRVVQETAAETNPICLFGEAVTPSAVFHETSPLQLESVTNVIDFRSPSIYMRQVFDKVSNVHPVGRPQDVVSASQLANLIVVKIGSQGDHTNRQLFHTKKNYDCSKLLDSKLTSSFTHVETQAKDNWKNNGELYEGLFEGKTTKDTELLLVRDQPDYERQVKFYHQLCPVESISVELQLAQEKSKQMEADARKADADARKAEADAEARKADARKIETEFEMLKFKVAHGLEVT